MNRRWWLIAATVLLLGLALGLLGRDGGGGLPFDPRSTEPQGAAALVEVLRALGADVEVSGGVPDDDTEVALLLVGGRDETAEDGLEGWVRAGGRLILADPSSRLNPAPVERSAGFDLFGSVPLAADCDHPALDGIGRVSSTAWTSMQAPSTATVSCLSTDDGIALWATPLGEGELVVFGGRGAWMNDRLDEHHNAALAVALVQPAAGTDAVVLELPAPGGGQRSLAELVPDRVLMALWQLAIAFGVLAWARSRRHGAAVEEELPTRIRGSQMVAAVGGLLERTGQRDAAAQVMQRDLARSLADLFGLPRGTPRGTLVEVVSARTGIDEERLWATLRERRITDDQELVALTRSIALFRGSLVAGERHRTAPNRPMDRSPSTER